MTPVHITTCPQCDWKLQKVEPPPCGSEEICPCCGKQFVPTWQTEDLDKPQSDQLSDTKRKESPSSEPKIQKTPQAQSVLRTESYAQQKRTGQTYANTSSAMRPETQPLTKMQGNILIMLLLIGLGMPFWGRLKPEQQWEYTIASGWPEDMDRMGRRGYELVSARWSRGPSGDWSYECIYKRPLRK